MKPTYEQLRDPKWWDEYVPYGATHFVPGKSGLSDVFWRIEDGVGVEAWAVGVDALVHYKDPSWAYDTIPARAISRPTKPAAPEWGGKGVPPVGCECEVRVSGDYWTKALVVGLDEEGGIPAAVCRVLDSYYAFSSKCTRPLRTKEQRERDDLAKFLTDFFFDDVSETLRPEDIADAIIAAGYRKEKQDD